MIGHCRDGRVLPARDADWRNRGAHVQSSARDWLLPGGVAVSGALHEDAVERRAQRRHQRPERPIRA